MRGSVASAGSAGWLGWGMAVRSLATAAEGALSLATDDGARAGQSPGRADAGKWGSRREMVDGLPSPGTAAGAMAQRYPETDSVEVSRGARKVSWPWT